MAIHGFLRRILMAEGWLRAASAVLLLAACSRREPERITIGMARLPAFGLVFIADAKGYFAARGLTVEQRRFSTGRDALTALAAGEVEAATAYATPVALRATRGDVEVLTTLHTATGATRIVARADRGIVRAEDLAGKRIGVSHGTNGEYLLHTVLAYAGVEDAARVEDVTPEAAVDALVHGEIDAVAIWPPHAERAVRMLGPGRAVEIRSVVYTEISVLATRDAARRGRRAAFVRFVAALADAERLVREHPEEAFQALRGEFGEIGEAELREEWGRIAPALGITHELADVLERESAWFRGRGRITGPPLDVATVLHPDVLAEVDPEAVTFVSPSRSKKAR